MRETNRLALLRLRSNPVAYSSLTLLSGGRLKLIRRSRSNKSSGQFHYLITLLLKRKKVKKLTCDSLLIVHSHDMDSPGGLQLGDVRT
jgi:hypothetical protein